MYYEVIYETGNHSIASYDNDEEAKDAISAHHERAKKGETGGPTGHPAERVVKVLKYDKHPQDHNENQVASADEILEAVRRAIGDSDVASITEVAAAVKDISDPGVDSGAHESNYKMQETGELTGWDGGSDA